MSSTMVLHYRYLLNGPSWRGREGNLKFQRSFLFTFQCGCAQFVLHLVVFCRQNFLSKYVDTVVNDRMENSMFGKRQISNWENCTSIAIVGSIQFQVLSTWSWNIQKFEESTCNIEYNCSICTTSIVLPVFVWGATQGNKQIKPMGNTQHWFELQRSV